VSKRRTHVAVLISTHKAAKKIVEEYERQGKKMSMEDAIYEAKKREEEEPFLGSWSKGGFRL